MIFLKLAILGFMSPVDICSALASGIFCPSETFRACFSSGSGNPEVKKTSAVIVLLWTRVILDKYLWSLVKKLLADREG